MHLWHVDAWLHLLNPPITDGSPGCEWPRRTPRNWQRTPEELRADSNGLPADSQRTPRGFLPHEMRSKPGADFPGASLEALPEESRLIGYLKGPMNARWTCLLSLFLKFLAHDLSDRGSPCIPEVATFFRREYI